MSISGRVGKQNAVHSYTGILLGNEKERDTYMLQHG